MLIISVVYDFSFFAGKFIIIFSINFYFLLCVMCVQMSLMINK